MAFHLLMTLDEVVTEDGLVSVAGKRILGLIFDVTVVSKLILYLILVLTVVLPLMTNVVLILQMTPTGLIDVVLTVNVILMMLIEELTFPGMAPTAVFDGLWILLAFGTEKIGVILVLTVLIDQVVVARLRLTPMVDAVVVVAMVVYLIWIVNLTLTVMTERLLLLKVLPSPEMVGITAFHLLMTLDEVVTEDGVVSLAVKRFLGLTFDVAVVSKLILYLILVLSLFAVLPLMTTVVLILQMAPVRLIDVAKNVILMMLIEVLTFPGMAPTAVFDNLWILVAFATEKIGAILVLTVLIDGVVVATLRLTPMVDAVAVVGMVVYVLPSPETVGIMALHLLMILDEVVTEDGLVSVAGKRILGLIFDVAVVSKLILYLIFGLSLFAVLPLMTNVVLILQMAPVRLIDVVKNVILMMLIEELTFPGMALITVLDVVWILDAFATEKIGVILVLTVLIDRLVVATLRMTTMGGAAVVEGMIVDLMWIPNLTLTVMTEMFLFLKVTAMTMIGVVPSREMVGIVAFGVVIILKTAVTEGSFAWLALTKFLMLAFDMTVVSNLALHPILVLSLMLLVMTDMLLILQRMPTRLIDVVLAANMILMMLVEVLMFPGKALIAVLDVLWILGSFGKENFGEILVLTVLIDGVVSPILLLTTMVGAAFVVRMVVYLMLILNLTLTVMIGMLLRLKVIVMTMVGAISAREVDGIAAFALKQFLMLTVDMAVVSKLALHSILVVSLMLPLMTNLVLVLQIVPTTLIDVVVTVNVILLTLIEEITFPGMALTAVLDVLWILGTFATEKIGVILVLTVLIDGVILPAPEMVGIRAFDVLMILGADVVEEAVVSRALKLCLMVDFDMALSLNLVLYLTFVLNLLLTPAADVVLALRVMSTILIDVVLNMNIILMVLIEGLTIPDIALIIVLDVLLTLDVFAMEEVVLMPILTLAIVAFPMLHPTMTVDATDVPWMIVHLMLTPNLMLTMTTDMLQVLKVIPMTTIGVSPFPEMVGTVAPDLSLAVVIGEAVILKLMLYLVLVVNLISTTAIEAILVLATMGHSALIVRLPRRRYIVTVQRIELEILSMVHHIELEILSMVHHIELEILSKVHHIEVRILSMVHHIELEILSMVHHMV
uniref:Uncharacterized protein n=1 Tax=Glossina austeni TaxID=7395 RepID=A0A1A9VGP4_GLOAU